MGDISSDLANRERDRRQHEAVAAEITRLRKENEELRGTAAKVSAENVAVVLDVQTQRIRAGAAERALEAAQAQVATLRESVDCFCRYLQEAYNNVSDGDEEHRLIQMGKSALSDTSATAEAHDKRVQLKLLDEVEITLSEKAWSYGGEDAYSRGMSRGAQRQFQECMTAIGLLKQRVDR